MDLTPTDSQRMLRESVARYVAENYDSEGRRKAAQEPQGMAATPEIELGRGNASWYGPRFHGRLTSNGERFDMNGMTAAHPTLPLGTWVRVRNLANGREVLVRINDRAKRMRDRVIDLSKAAAAKLGFVRAGKAPVVLIQR